ncbi:MAG TPA: CocE/NonD family hydrolase [Solirubrobacteraceae bacterium]|nr:CocE/NonD family hydrolase [Solirubrobacteraceae bacterium]
MPRPLRCVVVLCALLAAAPAAHAASTKSTHRVPVTQPDEAGRPVELDVDVYLPEGAPPPAGRPLVLLFHGGGSDKDSAFDAAQARAYAERGYGVLLYSARGHGGSSGQTTVAGPKEVRDGFDVLAWAFREGGRANPEHPDFGLDRRTILLAGHSEGGLHVNLLQAYAGDPALNAHGFRFAALQPGNTADRVFDALVEHDVVKLSFGLGLAQTYFAGTGGDVAPQVGRWIATAAVDRPELYGGDVCDASGHDTPAATMRADLAARSIGCRPEALTAPAYWMQAFDDELFPATMAVAMWNAVLEREPRSRLYLSMGGHAAPAAPAAVEREKTELRLDWLDHVLQGSEFRQPRVVYWSRDVAVPVPAGTRVWPARAWVRRGASRWPPGGVRIATLGLGADGRARASGAVAGAIPLNAPHEDLARDPVAQAAFAATPLGTAPSGPAPAGTRPGSVAVFATEPLAEATELSGAPVAALDWTPASPDSQLVLKLLAQAPDGALTLLTRGATGVRGAQPAAARPVQVRGQETSALLPAGTRLVTWITAGDASFYKAYPGSAGGVLAAGPGSTLALPLRPARGAASGGAAEPGTCADRRPPVSRVRSAAVRRGRLVVSGTARDRGCGARRVDRVLVTVSLRAGRRCRFVTDGGELSRLRACSRRLWLEPTGASRWRLTVPARRLPSGVYGAVVRAADPHGNLEPLRRANRRAFRIP